MMIKYKDLYKDIEPKYKEMIDKVNYINFKKCIAQFSGLTFDRVSDKALVSYLITWAKNKYRFYKMFNNTLMHTEVIHYEEQDKKAVDNIRELELIYPQYALWLDKFRFTKNNKIDEGILDYDTRAVLSRIYPNISIGGNTLTHFFKKYLNASDEVVTDIAKCFENQQITGNFTISIDPVDMMLASENPYDWQSCYRLENMSGSHADGCLAAILDNTTLITYIWNKSGDLSLYDTYDIKNINYKRMRMWISIAPNNEAIHFNEIYPGKSCYSQEFHKQLRVICEDFLDKDAIWKRNTNWRNQCQRDKYYGYEEYNYDNIWYNSNLTNDNYSWYVFNESIYCPCGCGKELIGSDELDDMNYNGEGFCCENFYESHYCELIDDYCDNYEDCENCPTWCRENAVCELDNSETCEYSNEAEDNECFDPYDGNVVSCGDHCLGCPLYKYHHPEVDEDEAHDEQMISGNDD